ncbi:hypothetical protein M1466_01190 [Candidatus Dependentiae bacterium]|nr:hypothetical protein [Candidatus Dependentiae bacterium]
MYYYFLLLVFAVVNMYPVLTVNDQNISELIKPSQALSCKLSGGGVGNIAFKYADNNITFGRFASPDENVVKRERMEIWQKVRGGYATNLTTKNITIRSGSIHYTASYLQGNEKIYMQATGALKLIGSTLHSPEITLVAQQVDFAGLFVEGGSTLQLESHSDTALFKAIKISFDKDCQEPALLQGAINLETGEMSETFIAFGVTEIAILFNESVFK